MTWPSGTRVCNSASAPQEKKEVMPCLIGPPGVAHACMLRWRSSLRPAGWSVEIAFPIGKVQCFCRLMKLYCVLLRMLPCLLWQMKSKRPSCRHSCSSKVMVNQSSDSLPGPGKYWRINFSRVQWHTAACPTCSPAPYRLSIRHSPVLLECRFGSAGTNIPTQEDQ